MGGRGIRGFAGELGGQIESVGGARGLGEQAGSVGALVGLAGSGGLEGSGWGKGGGWGHSLPNSPGPGAIFTPQPFHPPDKQAPQPT